MLQNRAISIVLIVVVGVIWINVILKIVGNFSSSDDTSSVNYSLDAPLLIPTPEDREFELTSNYRDPFLNQVKVTSTFIRNPEPTVRPIQTTIPSPHVPKPWPKIHYFGIVKQTTGNSGIALIKVDNFSMNLKKGEGFYEDYEVHGIYRDSIVIRRGKKELKSFYR